MLTACIHLECLELAQMIRGINHLIQPLSDEYECCCSLRYISYNYNVKYSYTLFIWRIVPLPWWSRVRLPHSSFPFHSHSVRNISFLMQFLAVEHRQLQQCSSLFQDRNYLRCTQFIHSVRRVLCSVITSTVLIFLFLSQYGILSNYIWKGHSQYCFPNTSQGHIHNS